MKRKGIYMISMMLFTVICNSCSQVRSSEGGGNGSAYPGAFSGSKLHKFVLKLESLSDNERQASIASFIKDNPHTPIIESDSVFSLYWYGKANEVLVNGDVQHGWSEADTMHRLQAGENGFFHISYKVPPDSRIDYTLVIDTVSMTDPRNRSITPSGYGDHSEVAMPGFKPDPIRSYRADIPHGSLDSLNFASSDTSISARQLKIYFPPGYKSMNSLLPVIYVLDGLEALAFMTYRNTMDNMIADHRMTPALVVFIPPGDRHNEKTGDKTEAFLKVICDELVPIIDLNYNSDPRPEKRAICGISSGGHFALLTLFRRYDVFRNCAGQSPTISDKVIDAMRTMIKRGKYSSDMKIYFDAGIFDLPGGTLEDMSFLEAARSLHTELDIHKISHIYREENDGHEWANWRERTDDILGYFFPAE
jgi:enterochelin esterase-like enzyme